MNPPTTSAQITNQAESGSPVAPATLKGHERTRASIPETGKALARAIFHPIPKIANFIVAVVLFVIAMLLIFPCYYFVMRFNDVPPAPKEFRDLQTLSEQFKRTSNLKNQVFSPYTPLPSASAELALTINQIRHDTPTKATLTGTLDLFFPSYFFKTICDQAAPATKADKQRCDEGSPIISETSAEDRLKPEYEPVNLVMTVYSFDGQFSQTRSLGKFFLPQGPYDIELPLSLSLETQASAYPEDWFHVDPIVDIRFSLPSLYVYDPSIPHRHFRFIPVDIYGKLNTSLSNMALTFAPPGWVYPLNGDGDIDLDILIQRNIPSKGLIYLALAFIPFALLLLFSHAIITQARQGKDLITNASLNILILMLTFIAIRQVFVPSDIQGVLSRIDYLTMIFATILLAVIFFSYATPVMVSVFRKKKSP